MYLPRPYPDELLGSLLIRASRRLGLKPRQLATVIGVDPALGTDFLVPFGLTRIAQLAAVPAEELLAGHTLFPFVCLTWDAQRIEELRDQIISTMHPHVHLCFRRCFPAGLRATTLRRFCPACIDADMQIYGEAYWHRLHAVPGVLVCPKHHVYLKCTELHVPGKLFSLNAKLPSEVAGNCIDWRASETDLHSLSTLAASTVYLEPGTWRDWVELYPKTLRSLGYCGLETHDLRRQLALDCREALGQRFLERIGLAVKPFAMCGWPISLARGEEPLRQVTFVHLLFRRFLGLV